MAEDGPGGIEIAERALAGQLERDDYRPMTQKQLLHRANVPPDARRSARRLIREMLDDGRLIKLAGGKLAKPVRRGSVSGRLQRHREGFGFVVPDDGGEDVFVAPGELGDALTGDRVRVRVGRRGRDGRVRGTRLEILDRRERTTLGLFSAGRRGGVVQPFDPVLRDPLLVPPDATGDAADGDAVRVELVRPATGGSQAEARVLSVIGHIDEPGTDVAVVSHRYGLDLEFPEDVRREAATLPADPPAAETRDRTRYDDPSPVTIDGETARDFDDAIAVRRLPDGGFRLWVHIADVAHVVEDDGVLDREARRRGTSVYFPDRVVPMFPEQLSAELCSLRPGVDRLVQSAIIDFDEAGHRTGVRYDDGVIRSAARLTYRQVAAWLADPGAADAPGDLLAMLREADRLRATLERRRSERGSIDFDLPEPEILLDVEGAMTGVRVEPRNVAHRMIEEFMLAANEAVAETLDTAGAPALFRVHEQPDPRKIEMLAGFVERYGLQLDADREAVAPRTIQALLEKVADRPESRVVSSVALRAMKQARYVPEDAGHFALAAPNYCHFTSPIRRYPDLVVHRALRAQRHGTSPIEEPLDGLGDTCSELERNAESAERELLLWKKVAFIAEHVGDTFDGVITGVAKFGVFVQLVENLVEGMVHVENLGDDRYDFDEQRIELVGSRSGRAFGLGDPLRVRVTRVDRALQRVDMMPEPGENAGSRTRSGARRNRRTRRKRSGSR